MALTDFILNIASLLLWLNWLSLRFDPLAKTSAASLVGTLRKADPAGPKRWKFLAALIILLALRAALYGQFSASTRRTPSLDLGIIDLSFRGDAPLQMLVFSLLDFSLTLAVFYLWLLFLSLVNSTLSDADPVQKLVRAYFRWLENWPRTIKLIIPFFCGAFFWLLLHPILARLAVVPPVKSTAQLFEQAAVMGVSAYLAWKYLIVGILLLHLLNSYVYLGNQPFWQYLNTTSRNLLYPIHRLPLRVGKVDFSPVVVIALVFFAAELVSHPPVWPSWYRSWFYHMLPF